ncbi:MAG: creatininase family protein [Planctomycetes bacterium]|nr:creatininase family protein [Planctomycetota bacterium]
MKKKSQTPRGPGRIPGVLEEMTVEEVRAFKPEVVMLPLGSTEPHGPHLPMGTDTYQAVHLARLATAKANARMARCLLYPVLPITNNANMHAFPFALRIGVRTLMSLLMDIITQVRSDGVKKVIILNGHGGNPGALDALLRELAGMKDMPFVCWTYGDPPADWKSPVVHASDHGGEDETGRMMYLRPDLVHTDKLVNNPVGKLKVPALAGAHWVRPWHVYVPRSAGGETRLASAEKGRDVMEATADGLSRLIVELSQAKINEKFPYK